MFESLVPAPQNYLERSLKNHQIFRYKVEVSSEMNLYCVIFKKIENLMI